LQVFEIIYCGVGSIVHADDTQGHNPTNACVAHGYILIKLLQQKSSKVPREGKLAGPFLLASYIVFTATFFGLFILFIYL